MEARTETTRTPADPVRPTPRAHVRTGRTYAVQGTGFALPPHSNIVEEVLAFLHNLEVARSRRSIQDPIHVGSTTVESINYRYRTETCRKECDFDSDLH